MLNLKDIEKLLYKKLKLILAKKEFLLAVLKNPKLPLHNNVSEDGARKLVMKRKVSGGIRTEAGKIAWENNLTILLFNSTIINLKSNFLGCIIVLIFLTYHCIFSKYEKFIPLESLQDKVEFLILQNCKYLLQYLL